MINRQLNEDGFIADFFFSDSGQPRKTIIMLGGSEGGKVWSRLKPLLKHFIDRGYNVLSLAYFKAAGLQRSLEEIPLEYFEKSFVWLAAQSEVVPEKYALIGGSKGGEAALLLGSRYPKVKAVVAINPSSVVWQGIPRNLLSIGENSKSSWSYGGKGLPYVPSSLTRKDFGALLTLRLRKTAEKDLQNAARVEEATIPVEKIQGAILLISSKQDQLWPSTPMCDQIVRRLESKEFPHYYEHVVYDMGHAGVVRQKASWSKVFRFLDEHFA